MQAVSYLPEVKKQYEHFPYPPRNPAEEKLRLVAPNLECLDVLNHFGFGGRRNFHKDFRVLIAGGGTGDAAVFMAEQLKGTQAEIVYLDLSQASMAVAKERASIRGLDNITWLQGSLLDLPNMGLGKFDYINSSGVLHHLSSPEAGLAALEGALAEGGVMGIMLYGKYGRTAIYQMQEVMRLLTRNDAAATKLDICKRVLARLPKTNWFHHSYPWFSDLHTGDAAIYDLLLHSQDRAYTVPDVYDYLRTSGLQFIAFRGYNQCEPLQYLADEGLRARVEAKPLREQYAIGEILCGAAKKQTFYAAREIVAPPSPDDPDMVPCLSVNTDPKAYEQLPAMAMKPGDIIAHTSENNHVRIKNHPALPDILKQMDGKRTLGEMYAAAAAQTTFGRTELQQAFRQFYDPMEASQMMSLRHKDVPYYLMVDELQARIKR